MFMYSAFKTVFRELGSLKLFLFQWNKSIPPEYFQLLKKANVFTEAILSCLQSPKQTDFYQVNLMCQIF